MVKKKSIQEKKEETLKHKARRTSIKEGIFAFSSFSLGDRYISPFAIVINASNSLVAMLSAVVGLLGPLSQMFGSKLIEKHSRKKVILKTIFLQSLMWMPLILVALLFYLGILVEILPLALLLFFSFYVIFANLGYPAWFSWMGDIIDEKHRGRYFSKRNLLTGFVTVVLSIASAFMLDYFRKQEWTIFGFMILFFLAMIFRLFSWRSFKKQYEPKLKLEKADHFSFWEFLIKLPKTNFGKFTIFRGLLAFSISISSPLVAVYLLRNLNFSYIIYMLIIISGTFFSLVFLELWGKIADKYGNYKVITLTTLIIPLIPLFWILSPSPIYLIFVPSMLGGIVWAGFILASGNFIYDNVRPQKRGIVISYFNMIIGGGVFLGAGLAALLIKFVDLNFIEPLFTIFIIGSIVRMFVVYVFLPKVKEVRKIKKFKGARSLKRILLHETGPTIVEEAHQIMHIKKYLRE